MMSRVVNQIFRGSTAAPGEPARSSDSVFDGMRGFVPQPRDFTSHFHQSLANLPDFPEQATFVTLFHSDSSLFCGSCGVAAASVLESLFPLRHLGIHDRQIHSFL